MWPFSRKRTKSVAVGLRETRATVLPVVHQRQNATTSRAESPTYSHINLTLFPLPETGYMSVVGESHYQQALHIVARGRAAGDTKAEHTKVTAALIPSLTTPGTETRSASTW
jgi:hypothetical protein